MLDGPSWSRACVITATDTIAVAGEAISKAQAYVAALQVYGNCAVLKLPLYIRPLWGLLCRTRSQYALSYLAVPAKLNSMIPNSEYRSLKDARISMPHFYSRSASTSKSRSSTTCLFEAVLILDLRPLDLLVFMMTPPSHPSDCTTAPWGRSRTSMPL